MTGRGRAALPYLYLLPAFLFFVPFVLVPFVHTVGLSFYEWDGLTRAAFVGLDNYREAFGSRLVRSAFGHALVLIFFFGVLPVLLALPLAVSSARTSVPGGNALRTLIFLPQAISTVVVGVSWGWILALDGPLNAALRALGFDGAAVDWLGSFTWALPSLGIVGTWTLIGLCVALFFAGLQQIPASLYDAAAVDGANRWREFRGRHPAGPQGADRGGADRHRRVRAADVRSRVRDDARRPGHGDRRAGPPDLSTRLRGRPAGLRGGDRGDPEHRRVHRDLPHQPDLRPESAVTAAPRTEAWNAAILISFAAITVLPIVGIVLLSLQPEHAPLSGFELPDRLHFENYARAFEVAHFGSYLKSSLIVSSAVVVGTVVVSTLAGYAFGTMRFAGENVLFYLLLTGLVIPFEAVIVPLYVELRAGNLTNSYWSVILPLIGTNSAFGTFWMRAYFRSVPRQLIEAAAIDGAGSLRILWKVLLPGCPSGPVDAGGARVHVVLERIPAAARHVVARGPAHGAARPRILHRPLHDGPRRHGRSRRDGRAAGGGAVRRHASALRARHVGRSAEAMTAPALPVAVPLTDAQRASFQRDGFLRIDAITDDAEVELLLGLYDELFRRDGGFDAGDRIELNADVARAPLPQVVNPERYAPRLVQGLAFRNAQAIARQLLGPGCVPTGNHAILKPARIGGGTPWHQDEAYWDPRFAHRAVSIWLALQPATLENGCMRFIRRQPSRARVAARADFRRFAWPALER